jgi:DNA-binding IclR family transcriptional regulator
VAADVDGCLLGGLPRVERLPDLTFCTFLQLERVVKFAAMVSGERNRSAYALNSVDNALRLVILLQERQELRLSEAAAELGVANSTAHRLLATLAHRGFVVQQRSRAYRRGPALEVRERPAPGFDLLNIAHPYLVRLSAEVEETCHLVILEGNGTRFLDCVEGQQVLRVGSRAGMLLPAHTNSGGKALLAQLTDAELTALYPRGIPPGRSRAVIDLPILRRELAATRRRGYGINRDESARGVSAVGRHISDATDRAVAALVVAAPSARCSRARLSELSRYLRETVSDLEAEL